MRIWTDRGIVIGRRNVGEADRWVTVFSRRHGKMVVLAKSVRAARSKRRAHIELFNTIKFQAVETGGAPVLAQTELLSDRSVIKSDIKLLRISYHLAEVVGRMTPVQEPHPQLFDLLDRALASVSLDTWHDEGRLTQAFAKKVLKLTGFGVPQGVRDLHLYIEELIESRLRSREILRD